MSLAVHKYPVQPGGFHLDMPKCAKLLSVQTQAGEPQLWALVDPDAPKEMRSFKVYGTGHDIDTEKHVEFVGTFQLRGGALVFHLFEELS